jgi:uncharacterized protein YjbI with pentapeptide repeats
MVVLKNIDGEVIKVFEDLDTLAGADLSYEDLMFADFRDMDLSNTCFEGADLYGAEFDDWVFDAANLDAPDFTDTYYEIVRHRGGGGHHYGFRGY